MVCLRLGYPCAIVALTVCSFGGEGEAGVVSSSQYSLVGTYSLPAGGEQFDVLPDGRLIVTKGDSILVQDAVHSSSYSQAGSIPTGEIAAWGASFIKVNPSGTRIAVGDNQIGVTQQDVILIDVADLDPGQPSPVTSVASSNFDAHWADDDTLYVSGAQSFGSPGEVTRIDALTLDTQVVIDGIQGASGGVTSFNGHVLTGNGFENGTGPSLTGHIRGFDTSAFPRLSGPVPFETSGDFVGDVLSAATLGTDHLGNLVVGGSDPFDALEPIGAAVVSGDAVQDALSLGTPVDTSDIQYLAPAGDQFYSILANTHTEELLVTHFGSDLVYRYAIPAPATGAFSITLGFLATRRRRRVAEEMCNTDG